MLEVVVDLAGLVPETVSQLFNKASATASAFPVCSMSIVLHFLPEEFVAEISRLVDG